MYYQVEADTPTERIRHVEELWGTLTPQKKAEWAKTIVDTHNVVVVPPKAEQRRAKGAPKGTRNTEGARVPKAEQRATLVAWKVKRSRVAKAPQQNAFSAYTQAMYHQMEENCPTERMKTLGMRWRVLPNEEKAVWATQGAEMREMSRQTTLQISTANPYAAFVKLKYQQAVGNSFAEKIKNIGLMWSTLSPGEKAEWKVLAQSAVHNTCEAPSTRLPNSMSLYVKATIAEAPAQNKIERMRYVAAQWRSLSIEEKAVWARKATELREASPHTARKRPKGRNGYHIFLSERRSGCRPIGAQARTEAAAEWKTVGPDVKKEYNRRAGEMNTLVAASPSFKGPPNSMSIFVKAMMAKAPAGKPQERMRYVGMQWRSLSIEEKFEWAQKAAELRDKSPSKD